MSHNVPPTFTHATATTTVVSTYTEFHTIVTRVRTCQRSQKVDSIAREGIRHSGLINRRAADDRANNLNILDLLRVHRMGVIRQYDEVRQLARRDGPF